MKVTYQRHHVSQKPTALLFYCPACKTAHAVGLSWQFNGSLENPTFSPSILVRSGHYARDNDPHPGNCYCDFHERYPEEEPMKWTCFRCHSYIKHGYIEYLSDCTHSLAGQTVPLPDIEATS